MFLELFGRSVLVVGSGSEAERRAVNLIGEGAEVTLLTTQGTSTSDDRVKVKALKRIRVHRRDLRGVFLVVATDRDRQTNEWLYCQSRKMGFLLNTLDEKETCNFYHTSVRKVHPSLEIAVSTGGASPAYASRLSTRLAREIGDDEIAVFDAFIAARYQLKDAGLSTFDFDWNALEGRLRSGSFHEPKNENPYPSNEVTSFEAILATGMDFKDEQLWPYSPFTNNFLDLRTARIKR